MMTARNPGRVKEGVLANSLRFGNSSVTRPDFSDNIRDGGEKVCVRVWDVRDDDS